MMATGDQAWRLDLTRLARWIRPATTWGVAAWSLLFAAAFPAALIAVWSGPFELALFTAPGVILAWGVVGFGGAVLTIRSFFRRAPHRALASAILPVSALAAALCFGRVWGLAIDTGEAIHFRLMQESYIRTVEAMPRKPFRLAIFNWGGLGVLHAIVYDESDQIKLAPDKRSPEWHRRTLGSELECGVWNRPLGDHFYIVRMGC